MFLATMRCLWQLFYTVIHVKKEKIVKQTKHVVVSSSRHLAPSSIEPNTGRMNLNKQTAGKRLGIPGSARQATKIPNPQRFSAHPTNKLLPPSFKKMQF